MKNIVYVENKYFVAVTHNGFKLTNLETKEKHYLSFEDVEILIFDNSQCYLSAKVIEKCADNKIGLLFCDRGHSPLSVLESVYGQQNRFERLKCQLSASSKVKGRLWRKIVISKIINQAVCLEKIGTEKESTEVLKSMTKTVTDHDVHNNEACAARLYFKKLFGDDFKRGRTTDLENAGLNYGYAILRALIRRNLVLKGFEPSIGIHHASTENPFNLSDDIIEPYRPFVDYYVFKNILPTNHETLESDDRKNIIKVLLNKCVINNHVMYLQDAIKLTIDSFVSSIEAGSSGRIKLPTFIEGGD